MSVPKITFQPLAKLEKCCSMNYENLDNYHKTKTWSLVATTANWVTGCLCNFICLSVNVNRYLTANYYLCWLLL